MEVNALCQKSLCTQDSQTGKPSNADEFFNETHTMVTEYLADGYDALEDFIFKYVPMDEKNCSAMKQGIELLHHRAREKVQSEMAFFRRTAMAHCFLTPLPQDTVLECPQEGDSPSVEYSAEAEEATDKELARLRKDVALARAASSQTRKDIDSIEAQIGRHGDPTELQEVLRTVDTSKVAEGAQALAEYAARLAPLLAEAEKRSTAGSAPQQHKRGALGASAQDEEEESRTASGIRKLRRLLGSTDGGAD